nr:hypothetical protein [Gemmatimonadaceae bacterium]
MSLLGRLRGRSARELGERAAHRLRVVAERAGLRAIPRWSPPVGVSLVPRVPVALPDDDALAALDEQLVRALLERADDAAQGRFALFGGPTHHHGLAPDWQRDPESGLRAPLVHWTEVPYLDPAIVGDHKRTWELGRHQWL